MSSGVLGVTLPELSVGPSVAGIDGSGGAATIPALTQAAAPDAAPGAAPGSDQQALIDSASRLGVHPRDLATVMSFESGMSPSIRGGSGNRHIGLIQFGPNEADQYGANQNQSFQEQLPAVEKYLTARGFKPGMGMLDLYSTINAGSPGRYNASDAGNGGTWGSVADKVNSQFGPHYAKADKFLAGTSFAGGAGGSATPGAANPGMSAGSTAMQGGFGLNGIQAQGGPIGGQAAPPGVASLVNQPMTAMGPTAQSMMPGQGAAQPASPYGGVMNALQSAAGAAGKAGAGQQKAGGGGGMPGQPNIGGNPISLQQARQMFDPSKFFTMLQAHGVVRR